MASPLETGSLPTIHLWLGTWSDPLGVCPFPLPTGGSMDQPAILPQPNSVMGSVISDPEIKAHPEQSTLGSQRRMLPGMRSRSPLTPAPVGPLDRGGAHGADLGGSAGSQPSRWVSGSGPEPQLVLLSRGGGASAMGCSQELSANSEDFRTSPHPSAGFWGEISQARGLGGPGRGLVRGAGPHGWGLFAVGWPRVPGPGPGIRKQL